MDSINVSVNAPDRHSFRLGELTRLECGYALCYTWEVSAQLWGPVEPPAPFHLPNIPDTSAAAKGTSSAVHEKDDKAKRKTLIIMSSSCRTCNICTRHQMTGSHTWHGRDQFERKMWVQNLYPALHVNVYYSSSLWDDWWLLLWWKFACFWYKILGTADQSFCYCE